MAKTLYSRDQKREVLNNGTYEQVKKRKRLIFQLEEHGLPKQADFERLSLCLDRQDNQDIDCAYRLAESTKLRKKRYNRKVTDFFDNGEIVYFLTLTFTDEVITNTTKETRRRYVARWLKENSTQYLANIDYGKTTEREHYHALMNGQPGKAWLYGFSKAERVGDTKKDYDKVGNYIAKLTNHALKETTEMNRVIYSRRKAR